MTTDRVSYYHWIREKMDRQNCIRPMKKEDVKQCIEMTLESFGDQYPIEQFESIEEEFLSSFEKDWWGRPKYFVFEYHGCILGMAGYQISPLDWGIYEFFWLSVRKQATGRGIGKLLVEHREKEILKEPSFKKDVTILFSCTKDVVKYHKKNKYKVLIKKAGGKEVIMGKTFKYEKK